MARSDIAVDGEGDAGESSPDSCRLVDFLGLASYGDLTSSSGVVQITATSVSQGQVDPFNVLPATPQTSQSLGSGFVIDKAGVLRYAHRALAGLTFRPTEELIAAVQADA